MAKKIALVTGAMGGLGTAICKSLAQSGFTVVANCLPNFPPKDEWLAKMKSVVGLFVLAHNLLRTAVLAPQLIGWGMSPSAAGARPA